MGSDELSNIISNFYDDSRQIHFTFEMWIHGTVSFNNNLRRLIVFIDQSMVMRFLSLRVGVQGREPLTHSGIEGWGASIPKISPTLFSQLFLADGNWSDSEGCIARRSWMHYRTEYRDMLQTSPFEFLLFSGFPERQFLRTTWWHLLYRHRTHHGLWNKNF